MSRRVHNEVLAAGLAVFMAGQALSATVCVTERFAVAGETNLIREVTAEAGVPHRLGIPPLVEGAVFVRWLDAQGQEATPRHVTGRALETPELVPYSDMALTAEYLPLSQDEDADGIPDGYELHWYGNLAQGIDSDTDGDGWTLLEEARIGRNPLLPDIWVNGGAIVGHSTLVQFNPTGAARCRLRSDPAGVLFADVDEVRLPGSSISTPVFSPRTSCFAYWSVNGIVQRDEDGRALDGLQLTMGSSDLDIVAVCVTDESERMGAYWYGTGCYLADSDTDGDGRTFAEEIAAGTNPLVAEVELPGGVSVASSEPLDYGFGDVVRYVVRSEPEGALFATKSGIAEAGQIVETETFSPKSSRFAYWLVDGVRQASSWGFAAGRLAVSLSATNTEIVAVTESDPIRRMSLYWYGTPDVDMASDTDGDGRSFAQEIAAGSSPLFPDSCRPGGVIVARTEDPVDVNLQPYDRICGALVDGAFTALDNWPAAVQPVVADVDGDGLWDIVVCAADVTNVFLNVGVLGAPEFVRSSGTDVSGVDLGMNSVDKLAKIVTDVPPVDALSATTNGTEMLVSDVDGRIWYYTDAGQPPSGTYRIQHKVWGGSRPGFASGLRLAAVDWDDDGDLDCLCGTADGRLFLLLDPKVGRPTNLRAAAGVDNVLLSWDPNPQSRIRGYKLYRSEALEPDAEQWSFIAEPALPTHRDCNLAPATYGYRVSALSRFYTAGNSTPTITESVPSEPVSATIGDVKFFWNDASCKVGDKVEVMLSIENSLNYNVAGMSQVARFDPEYLEFVKVGKTSLTEYIEMDESCVNEEITVSISSGALVAGSGKFLTFLFEAKKAGSTQVGGATVTIEAGTPDPMEVPRYSLGDVNGDGKIDEADIRELAKLKDGTGRKCTVAQLKAGDFNGNGRLDNADWQALRALVSSKKGDSQ